MPNDATERSRQRRRERHAANRAAGRCVCGGERLPDQLACLNCKMRMVRHKAKARASARASARAGRQEDDRCRHN